MLSNHNAQTPPNRTPSSPSEYSTLPPYPASVNDSNYKTPFPDTYPRPLNNVDSVYETPPEPIKPTNPFDAQLTDTPYLTPKGLPHFKILTVKQKLPKRLNDMISSLTQKTTNEKPRKNELTNMTMKTMMKPPHKTLSMKIGSDKARHPGPTYPHDTDSFHDENKAGIDTIDSKMSKPKGNEKKSPILPSQNQVGTTGNMDRTPIRNTHQTNRNPVQFE